MKPFHWSEGPPRAAVGFPWIEEHRTIDTVRSVASAEVTRKYREYSKTYSAKKKLEIYK